jgi:hypothetical protein
VVWPREMLAEQISSDRPHVVLDAPNARNVFGGNNECPLAKTKRGQKMVFIMIWIKSQPGALRDTWY